MRSLYFTVLALLALATLVIPSFSQQGGGVAGTPGAMNGRYKNGSHSIVVSMVGTTAGDLDITFSEGSCTGSAIGTPDPDGGAADSSVASVCNEEYRVKNGDVQWKNALGRWVRMQYMGSTMDAEGMGGLPGHGGGASGTGFTWLIPVARDGHHQKAA